jgi:hypothetical protein
MAAKSITVLFPAAPASRRQQREAKQFVPDPLRGGMDGDIEDYRLKAGRILLRLKVAFAAEAA